ncbi:MAG: hypothetical protein LBT66_08385 [Methanobrevibacter sp.]|jgi:hypothetical protein|nr:hypothetical protein [Candidatus Methanovirga meridionalis]
MNKKKIIIILTTLLIIFIALIFTNNLINDIHSKEELKFTLLGSNSNGSVELIGPIGNVNSKIKIAYIIGIHPLESFSHTTAYNTLFSYNQSLKYCYYIYRINVTDQPKVYETGRMHGQVLGEKFIVPNIDKENYSLVMDIHSNEAASGYAKTDSIFAPENNTDSKRIAEKIIANTNQTLIYFYPEPQTSPKFVTLPIIKAGIPAIIFESDDGESVDIRTKRIEMLINAVDDLKF